MKKIRYAPTTRHVIASGPQARKAIQHEAASAAGMTHVAADRGSSLDCSLLRLRLRRANGASQPGVASAKPGRRPPSFHYGAAPRNDGGKSVTRNLLIASLIAIALLLPARGFAACSNPAGVAGETLYNADHSVMQFCNGTDWVSMAASGLGTEVDPKVGTLTNGKWCSSNGTIITCTEDAPVSGAGGSSGQVQYNDGTGLGGAAAVTYATSGDLLMLTSQAATDIPLIVKGAASQSGNLTEWRNSSDSALVVVDESGNVGIGTTSPTAHLQVYNDQDAATKLHVYNPNTGAGAFSQASVSAAGATAWLYTFGSGYLTSGRFIARSSLLENAYAGGLGLSAANASGTIRFYTNSDNERMRITSDGNVGIGTASPASLLDIRTGAAGPDPIVNIQTSGTQAGLKITDASANATLSSSALTLGAQSYATLGYSSNKVTLRSGSSGWAIRNSAGSGGFSGDVLLGSDSGNLSVYGNVGIGTASPSSKLDIAGGDIELEDFYSFGWGNMSTRVWTQ